MSHLVGSPVCPGCLNVLDYIPMPVIGETYWYCKPCKMWWETSFLIQCLEEEELFEYLEEVENVYQ